MVVRAPACYQCGPGSAPTTQHQSFFINSSTYPGTLSLSKSNMRQLNKHLTKSLPSFNIFYRIPGKEVCFTLNYLYTDHLYTILDQNCLIFILTQTKLSKTICCTVTYSIEVIYGNTPQGEGGLCELRGMTAPWRKYLTDIGRNSNDF